MSTPSEDLAVQHSHRPNGHRVIYILPPIDAEGFVDEPAYLEHVSELYRLYPAALVAPLVRKGEINPAPAAVPGDDDDLARHTVAMLLANAAAANTADAVLVLPGAAEAAGSKILCQLAALRGRTAGDDLLDAGMLDTASPVWTQTR